MKILMECASHSDPLAKLIGNPDRKGIGLNLYQPYLLLMVVPGVVKGKEFPVGAVLWTLIYWGGPLQFLKLEGAVQSTRRVNLSWNHF